MKKGLSLLITLALSFSLTACGAANSPAAEETVTTPSVPVETTVPAETTPPSMPPEEVFAKVGTFKSKQLTASKALAYVCMVENEEELSREIDQSLLPDTIRAETAKEVRYIVLFKYCAELNPFYSGPLEVYSCSITAEIQNAFNGKVIAEESFSGPALPDQIVSSSGKYYGEYPDEAEVRSWVEQTILADVESKYEQALQEAQRSIDHGSWSYDDLFWLLTESELKHFTVEEAVYALENCQVDWFAEALEFAENYSKDGNDPSELSYYMEMQGFTPEQIAYAVEKYG